MINKILEFFERGKDVSVIKRFLNNPDKFILMMETKGNKIIISIEEKEMKKWLNKKHMKRYVYY